MLPMLAGLGLLLLLGGKSSAKPKKLPAAPLRVVAPGGKVMTSAPKSAPKSYDVAIGPVKLRPAPPPVTANPGLGTPLTKAPSQGGSPSLDTPLSADTPSERYVPIVSMPAARPTVPPPRSQTPGVNLEAARRGSSAVAANLKRKGKAGYDRRALSTWQKQAGLAADGLYGAKTRAALLAHGVKDPPPPFV
jgi:peptidoglycan hydrolase-like protein with peptidoglycan-binding domain